MAMYAGSEGVWLNKYKYDDAERKYYEAQAKDTNKVQDIPTPLAAEVEKAREWLTTVKKSAEETDYSMQDSHKSSSIQSNVAKFEKALKDMEEKLNKLTQRVMELEEIVLPLQTLNMQMLQDEDSLKTDDAKEMDDDNEPLDLFGSSDDEDHDKILHEVRTRHQEVVRIKKSKAKSVTVSKSNIILDVKPYDSNTDMKQLEDEVRKIQCDGLVWGASRLVPVAYGIQKLQIMCVIEDDKVSVNWFQETIEGFSENVQSVDITASYKKL